jgi:signal transduction histidine kinase
MEGVIRQLLDFARRRKTNGATANVRDVVERSLEMLEPLLDKSGTRVELEVGEGNVRVAIDADSLQQVVTNLAVNATQAMQGGGALGVTIRRAGDASVQIELRDHGPGIPAELVEQIFDPFFTTKGPGEGTGLGLSIAHGIVVQHGGRIDVKSESGQGTTFVVVLPTDRNGTEAVS